MKADLRNTIRFFRRWCNRVLVALAACVHFAGLQAHAKDVYQLKSPDGAMKVTIRMPAPGSQDRPRWSATFRGKTILSECGLGLQTADGGDLMLGAKVLRERSRKVDTRIPVLFGKSETANDRFREIRFTLETSQKRQTDVIFRCYDDGVAVRYELPVPMPMHGNASVTVTDESTSFHVDGAPVASVQYLENYNTSHEHNVVSIPCGEIRRDALLDMPLTFAYADGTYVAITEAALRGYAGMALMRTTGKGARDELVCKLTPRPDGTKVVRALPLRTPWRVVLIGKRPGALLESQTIYCLNDPPAFKDLSWIKPGKLTFPWWNGDVYDGKPGTSILSVEMARKYIDFCAANGISFHAMTSTETILTPWYHQSNPGIFPGPDTDVTRPRDSFDLPTIHKYAESKSVRLWTWVHQAALRGKVETAFTAFEKMGWAGMMIDFFDHDDQDSVEFAESILEAAARHHILIHFHGVWKPTGWQRTYPNLMNHEGALNLEYDKFMDKCTPEHDLNMAFTRLIAGPMDYHLGGFRAVTRANFKPRQIAPNVLGTRCHLLAMYVCFDNPSPMVADYPTAYDGQAGFDFIKIVPTWWDETKVLVDKPDEILVTARRKGKTWYVGGLSAHGPRSVEVPLSFLGKGRHTARIWKDASDVESDPNHLVNETSTVSSSETMTINVGRDGGFVAEFLTTDGHR